MIRVYKLVNRVPIESALADFAQGRDEGWIVARSVVGPVEVFTDFLGVAANSEGPPQCFETATRDRLGAWGINGRCATWAEAEEMHGAVVARLQAHLAG